MRANDNDPFSQVISKLERMGPIDEDDRQALRNLPFRTVTAKAHDYLVREGDVTTQCCVLLTGFACRHKSASSGGRQIVSFHMAGDILDVQHLLLPHADHNLQTITPATYATVPSAELRQVTLDRPNIGQALWRDSLIDASVFREWVLNVGRRDAKMRVAHMLCEFATRREVAGLGSPESFELPMTQEHIADATGLTPVHVNRMLGQLTRDGVIRRDNRRIEISDWALMRRIADFDPAYLHAAA